MSTSACTLSDIRSRIDRLDQRLVELLALRQAAVDDIAEVKEQADRCVRDPKRESELMDRLRDIARQHDVSADLVEDLYGTIIEHSVARQSDRRSTSAPKPRLRKVS